jgi:hypothetical protein
MRSLTTLALAAALAGTAGVANAQGDCQSGDGTPTIVPAGDITGNVTWGGLVILQGPVFVKNNATLTILGGSVVRGQPRQLPVEEGETDGTPGAIIITQTGRIDVQGTAADPVVFTTAATDNDNNGIADDSVTLDPDTLTYSAGSDGLLDPWESGDTFMDDTCNTAPLAPLDKSTPFPRDNTQMWGGVVLLGEAPTNNANKCGVGYGRCTVEGLTFPGFAAADAQYGGPLPNDSSGRMRYFSIRHAGDELGNGNELNGLSMGGVGKGTLIEFGEVYANFDDCFEWFGGTVNGNHLLCSYNGDDNFDTDEGYTGINQFALLVMPFFRASTQDIDPVAGGHQADEFGSASGDKGAELDGDNYRPDNTTLNDNVNIRQEINGATQDTTPWPLSHPAFWNVTVIGSTPDAAGRDFTPAALATASTNRGIQFRNGFAGDVFNSIVVNTGSETGLEVENETDAAPGFNANQNAANNLARLVCTTVDDGDDADGDDADESNARTNGNTLAVALGAASPGSANVVRDPGGVIVASAFLVDEDQTFDPQGTAGAGGGKLASSLKTPLNPRPVATGFPPPPIAGCPAPQGELDATATYRGAFQSSASVPLWTGDPATNSDWNVLSSSGLMVP